MSKLDNKVKMSIFVGYDEKKKGWRQDISYSTKYSRDTRELDRSSMQWLTILQMELIYIPLSSKVESNSRGESGSSIPKKITMEKWIMN